MEFRTRTMQVVGLLVVAAVLAGGWWYWRWLTSPRYSLHQMVLALKARDVERLLYYVDFPSIVDSLSREAAEELAQILPGSPEPDAVERFGRRVLEKLARALPPKAAEALTPALKAAVGTYLEHLSTTQLLGLAAAVSTARIERRGDKATVILDGRGQVRFEMVRDPKDGVWRIAGVRYQDLKEFLLREWQ